MARASARRSTRYHWASGFTAPAYFRAPLDVQAISAGLAGIAEVSRARSLADFLFISGHVARYRRRSEPREPPQTLASAAWSGSSSAQTAVLDQRNLVAPPDNVVPWVRRMT